RRPLCWHGNWYRLLLSAGGGKQTVRMTTENPRVGSRFCPLEAGSRITNRQNTPKTQMPMRENSGSPALCPSTPSTPHRPAKPPPQPYLLATLKDVGEKVAARRNTWEAHAPNGGNAQAKPFGQFSRGQDLVRLVGPNVGSPPHPSVLPSDRRPATDTGPWPASSGRVAAASARITRV